MSARIQLDGDKNTYTSFDCISGKIIVFLSNDEDISAIVVKLEGESFSKLLRPSNAHNSNNGRRDSIATEVHKVLYQVHQVFPRLHSESSRSASKILQAVYSIYDSSNFSTSSKNCLLHSQRYPELRKSGTSSKLPSNEDLCLRKTGEVSFHSNSYPRSHRGPNRHLTSSMSECLFPSCPNRHRALVDGGISLKNRRPNYLN